jgi:hypothetical protein
MSEHPSTPAVVDALMARVLAVHGHRLDSEQRAVVRARVEQLQQAAALVAAYPLTNADEPDAAFAAVDAGEPL